MLCPRCQTGLHKHHYQEKVFAFSCPVCKGIALTLGGLRSLRVDEENIRNIWEAAIKGKSGTQLPCPECRQEMQIIKVNDGQTDFYIDICTKCHIIWFDPGELEKIPVMPEQPVEDIPQRAKEILAENAIKNVRVYDDKTMRFYRSRAVWIPAHGEDPVFWLMVVINALGLLLRIIR